MKQIEECTEIELLTLTNDEINEMIDYQCATQGIPLLPEEPVLKMEKPQIVPDIVMYSVGDLMFSKQEDALDLCDHLANFTLYSSEYLPNGGYNYQTALATDEPPSINQRKFYSKAYWNTVKGEMETFKEVEAGYNKLKEEYNEIKDRRDPIEDKIRNTIAKARDAKGRKIKYGEMYLKYLGLANGDKEIAMKFLTDAHPEVSEIENFNSYIMEIVLTEATKDTVKE